MSLANLQDLLSDPSPGFRCYAAGDNSEKLRFIAAVKHILGKPATSTTLKALDSQVGGAGKSLRKLIELHDGMVLFRDKKSVAAGFELFRVADWKRQTKEMQTSMREMGFEDEHLPKWFGTGVVVGQIPHSANYFVLGTEGKDAGKVFYANHDDFRDKAVAKDIESLIKLLIRDPAQFFYDHGCYTRYYDGKTEKQWIPKQYVSDIRV